MSTAYAPTTVPLTLVVDIDAVVEHVVLRNRITYFDSATDSHRIGVDILGFGGDTSDILATTVRLADSMVEWEIPLMALAKMHEDGCLAKYRPGHDF